MMQHLNLFILAPFLGLTLSFAGVAFDCSWAGPAEDKALREAAGRDPAATQQPPQTERPAKTTSAEDAKALLEQHARGLEWDAFVEQHMDQLSEVKPEDLASLPDAFRRRTLAGHSVMDRDWFGAKLSDNLSALSRAAYEGNKAGYDFSNLGEINRRWGDFMDQHGLTHNPGWQIMRSGYIGAAALVDALGGFVMSRFTEPAAVVSKALSILKGEDEETAERAKEDAVEFTQIGAFIAFIMMALSLMAQPRTPRPRLMWRCWRLFGHEVDTRDNWRQQQEEQARQWEAAERARQRRQEEQARQWEAAERAHQRRQEEQARQREAAERARQRRQEEQDRQRDVASVKMSAAQALEILGISPGASEHDIRAAYNHLMKRVHPDVGGSAYFSKQLNAARDVLLRQPRA
jgi:hypothetical protein